jgi:predicted  nucleic acid-binding Zn-ribbon protein
MTTEHQYLPSLFMLHDVDLALADIKQRTEDEKKRVENFAAAFRSRQKEREKLAEQLKTAGAAAKSRELELDELNQKKAAKEKQVLRVVNARELEAINHEIEKLGNQIPAKETEVLEAMEIVEKLQKLVDATDEDLKKRQAQAPKLKVDVDQKLKQLEADLSQRTKEREALEPAIDESARSKYATARKANQGPILFEIRENACGGCGLPRAGYEWNKLHQNPGHVYECSDCGRLNIYVGEPP